uniref:Uncharacterized protein n=1 Tax=Caenorhabditis japonica TaxID=281687 RepID=A0A8R1E866_CAEJA
MELYASVPYYAEATCKLSGICKDDASHDKHLKDYVRAAKLPRPTAPPVAVQRPNGGVSGPNNPIIVYEDAEMSAVENCKALLFSLFAFVVLFLN